jgi:hypothetical protein
MAVSVAAAPESPPPPQRPRTRRGLLRGLLGAAAALALAPLVAASRPTRRPAAPQAGFGGSFDEIYRGRRLHGTLAAVTGLALGEERWQVTIDGRPLHLMRRADGTWLTMVDHYRSYATPLEAARAAVDALGPGEKLRAVAVRGGLPHAGGHHGLHP